MAFKLPRGKATKKSTFNTNHGKTVGLSVPGTPIYRKKLGKGIDGEANNDGSIFISNKIEPGCEHERMILMHEMKHQVDMKTGKLSYTDNSLTWMGESYERKDGFINYQGEWLPEGSKDFPWEQH